MAGSAHWGTIGIWLALPLASHWRTKENGCPTGLACKPSNDYKNNVQLSQLGHRASRALILLLETSSCSLNSERAHVHWLSSWYLWKAREKTRRMALNLDILSFQAKHRQPRMLKLHLGSQDCQQRCMTWWWERTLMAPCPSQTLMGERGLPGCCTLNRENHPCAISICNERSPQVPTLMTWDWYTHTWCWTCTILLWVTTERKSVQCTQLEIAVHKEIQRLLREIIMMKLSVEAVDSMKLLNNTNRCESVNRGISASLPKNVNLSRNALPRASLAVHRLNNGVGQSTLQKLAHVGAPVAWGGRVAYAIVDMQRTQEYQRSYHARRAFWIW